MAFVHDSESIARIEIGDNREAHRQDIADTTNLMTTAEVTNFDASPTNPMRQWGNGMPTATFEMRLIPLMPPFCKIFPHPTNETKRCLYITMPDGTLEHITTWEAMFMPEFSVCYEHVEDVPDMTVGVSDATAISRADLPPHTWDAELGEFVFDTTHQPLAGMKRVKTVGGEAIRGWRSVLQILVAYTIITPAQAELAFGAADRKEWAHSMGKQKTPTPWCG
jgi:hypothetical protein